MGNIKKLKSLSKTVKLLVLDLDGTALGGYQPYKKIPEPLCNVLDFLNSKGILWCINTTWGIAGQWELVKESPLKSRPAFLMAETGAEIAEIRNNEICECVEYNKKIKNKIIAGKPEMWEIATLLINEVSKPDKFYFLDYRIVAEYNPSLIPDVQVLLKKFPQIKKFCNCFLHNTTLTLIPKDIGKDKALKEVQKMTGIRFSETIAAGDEATDIPMMNMAEFIICPANASDFVKKHVGKKNGIISNLNYCDGIIDGLFFLVST